MSAFAAEPSPASSNCVPAARRLTSRPPYKTYKTALASFVHVPDYPFHTFMPSRTSRLTSRLRDTEARRLAAEHQALVFHENEARARHLHDHLTLQINVMAAAINLLLTRNTLPPLSTLNPILNPSLNPSTTASIPTTTPNPHLSFSSSIPQSSTSPAPNPVSNAPTHTPTSSYPRLPLTSALSSSTIPCLQLTSSFAPTHTPASTRSPSTVHHMPATSSCVINPVSHATCSSTLSRPVHPMSKPRASHLSALPTPSSITQSAFPTHDFNSQTAGCPGLHTEPHPASGSSSSSSRVGVFRGKDKPVSPQGMFLAMQKARAARDVQAVPSRMHADVQMRAPDLPSSTMLPDADCICRVGLSLSEESSSHSHGSPLETWCDLHGFPKVYLSESRTLETEGNTSGHMWNPFGNDVEGSMMQTYDGDMQKREKDGFHTRNL